MHFDAHFFILFSKLANKTAQKVAFTGVSDASTSLRKRRMEKEGNG